MLGDHPVRIGHGVRSRVERFGAGQIFEQVKAIFLGSDVVFGNLEVVHSDIGRVEGKLASMEFRGLPGTISELRSAGFNALNVANNHCLEHGIDAFEDTVQRLEERGIGVVGLRGTAGHCRPCVCDVDGASVALLGYSLRPEAYFKGDRIPYALAAEADILADVDAAARKYDTVIVSLHWGEEFMSDPSRSQVLFARSLVEAGARVVLGHHPHVLQAVERHGGGVIAYSLGNFVFDMWQRSTRQSAILQIRLAPDSPATFEIHPVRIDRKYRPIPLDGARRARALLRMQAAALKLQEIHAGARRAPLSNEERDEAAQYLKIAQRKTLAHRLGNYAYFAANIFRYDPMLVLASLMRSASRRLDEASRFVQRRRRAN
jgi:poly-gamma-glutamate synthesis protein (capsule biosynthesis protein)